MGTTKITSASELAETMALAHHLSHLPDCGFAGVIAALDAAKEDDTAAEALRNIAPVAHPFFDMAAAGFRNLITTFVTANASRIERARAQIAAEVEAIDTDIAEWFDGDARERAGAEVLSEVRGRLGVLMAELSPTA